MPRVKGSDRLVPKVASLCFRMSQSAAGLIERHAFEGECQAVTAARLIRWAIADGVSGGESGPGGEVTIEVAVEHDEYLRIQQLAQSSGRSEQITAKDLLYGILLNDPKETDSREPVTDADELIAMIDGEINRQEYDPDFGLWLHPLALALRDRCSMPSLREWLAELRDEGEIHLISTPSTDPPMIAIPLPDGKPRSYSRLKRVRS